MRKQHKSGLVVASIMILVVTALFLPVSGIGISRSAAAEPCECDLNNDGVCDMQDWLVFGQDWGRTDCPPCAPVVYPVSLAMDGTVVPWHTFSNILINGNQISGPVAPGASVQVTFDWSREQIPECSACIHQHYVGFAGEPAICVQSGFAPASGSADVTLVAPNTPGPHVIAGAMTLELGCQNITIPANPDFGAYVAVVTVLAP